MIVTPGGPGWLTIMGLRRLSRGRRSCDTEPYCPTSRSCRSGPRRRRPVSSLSSPSSRPPRHWRRSRSCRGSRSGSGARRRSRGRSATTECRRSPRVTIFGSSWPCRGCRHRWGPWTRPAYRCHNSRTCEGRGRSQSEGHHRILSPFAAATSRWSRRGCPSKSPPWRLSVWWAWVLWVGQWWVEASLAWA